MNRLVHTRGYLCGAMDRVPDGGVQWRQILKDDLVDLKVDWMDPTCKPIDIGIEDLENRQERRAAKDRGDFDFVRHDMKIIRHVDLRMVDISDFLVVNLDMEVHACGTWEEVSLANRQKKPIIAHIEQGKVNAPDWLLAMHQHTTIFSTWQEVHAYLRGIARADEFDSLGRWLFFDWMGE